MNAAFARRSRSCHQLFLRSAMWRQVWHSTRCSSRKCIQRLYELITMEDSAGAGFIRRKRVAQSMHLGLLKQSTQLQVCFTIVCVLMGSSEESALFIEKLSPGAKKALFTAAVTMRRSGKVPRMSPPANLQDYRAANSSSKKQI